MDIYRKTHLTHSPPSPKLVPANRNEATCKIRKELYSVMFNCGGARLLHQMQEEVEIYLCRFAGTFVFMEYTSDELFENIPIERQIFIGRVVRAFELNEDLAITFDRPEKPRRVPWDDIFIIQRREEQAWKIVGLDQICL